MSEPKNTKTIDLSVELDAPPEAVWKAISDAEQLRRWFPLNATVEPGVGGSVTLDWGPDCAGTGRIVAWEEGSHLRYTEGPEVDEATSVAVDYTIETRGGKTVLRLVHSGLSADDDWAEYVDTVDSGWRYFLWNLKHYLERHRGTPRRMVWDRRKIAVPKAEAWELLFGGQGLVAGNLPVQKGAGIHLWSGHSGRVQMTAPPIHLACMIDSLNDAALLIELEPGEGAYSLGVWLSLYGLPEEAAASLQASLGSALGELFEPVEASRQA